MLKTPERYLDEIRARELRIFYRGERFDNPVDHPVAAPAARCVAETYAAALEPDSGMAVESPLVREPVNVSNLLWTRRDDLIARVRWERWFGRRTGRGADVVIGAASLIARANGVADSRAIRDKLTEMVHLNETMYYMTASPAVPARERMALFRLLEFLTHGSGAVYFLHESLHGAGAPEAMRIQLRREIPLEPFEAAARSLLAP
ncbi:MAG TPA: 4-hydroxyphenylacetate 3-hydroxylase C-terminal domain-containing protein [Kofleriaceae bacterium]|nr:4-hydroxyphenylacetate 3-hydroxylase C-terminal domain-containing protein [Kofleriaceae bacterium]